MCVTVTDLIQKDPNGDFGSGCIMQVYNPNVATVCGRCRITHRAEYLNPHVDARHDAR